MASYETMLKYVAIASIVVGLGKCVTIALESDLEQQLNQSEMNPLRKLNTAIGSDCIRRDQVTIDNFDTYIDQSDDCPEDRTYFGKK